jgi:hypothetical protein
MSTTGSGIVLVGYADTIAGIILCRACGDNNGEWDTMDPVYSPDTNDDTPPCFACGAVIG